MKKKFITVFLICFMICLNSYSVPLGYTDNVVGNFNVGSYAYGGTVDAEGNIYLGNRTTSLYKMTPQGDLSTFHTFPKNAIAPVISGNYMYVGMRSGEIYKINMGNPSSSTLFADFGKTINDIKIAPDSWGGHANKLLVASTSGVLHAFDQNTAAVTAINNQSNIEYSSIDFDLNGDIVAVRENDQQMDIVTPTGQVTTESMPFYSDGVAIHPGTGEKFFIDDRNNEIKRLDNNGQYSVFVDNLYFSGGWNPSFINFSTDGSILYYENQNTDTIHAITGFDSVSTSSEIPELNTLSLLLFAALIFILRKYR